MHKRHPNYTHQPLQEELAREHFLHRLVAGSAFFFALCILPVAQYFLVGGRGIEQGLVEGVSTEVSPAATVLQSIPENGLTLVECTNKKEVDRSDLERFLEGKKKALLREYEKAAEPYNVAIALLRQTPGVDQESEIASLETLIDTEYQVYLKEMSAVDVAVVAQQAEIEARVCPAE